MPSTIVRIARPTAGWGTLLAVVCMAASPSPAAELDGFTEPFRTVNVASPESGIVSILRVREGDVVRQDQPLVELDKELHAATLAIAAAAKDAQGRLDAAQAELQIRRERLQKLAELWEDGHARREEVERAGADVAVSQANLRAAREDLAVKQLEYEKILVLMQRRIVRAPIDGTVVRILKQPGEFVAPNDPYLLTLVQLDPLLAVFSADSHQAAAFHVGQKMEIRIAPQRRKSVGVVEYVSPVTDAESGTVQIKVRVANPRGEYRSGEHCRLLPAGSR